MGWIPVEMLVPDVDLFRGGNAGGPRMDHLREGHDANVVLRNGVPTILADGGGISLFTKKGAETCGMTFHWYILEEGTPLPGGLKLIHDSEGALHALPRREHAVGPVQSALRVHVATPALPRKGRLMPPLNALHLSDRELRTIIATIYGELLRLKHVNATATDEDVQADAGNAYAGLHSVWEGIREKAIESKSQQWVDELQAALDQQGLRL